MYDIPSEEPQIKAQSKKQKSPFSFKPVQRGKKGDGVAFEFPLPFVSAAGQKMNVEAISVTPTLNYQSLIIVPDL